MHIIHIYYLSEIKYYMGKELFLLDIASNFHNRLKEIITFILRIIFNNFMKKFLFIED